MLGDSVAIPHDLDAARQAFHWVDEEGCNIGCVCRGRSQPERAVQLKKRLHRYATVKSLIFLAPNSGFSLGWRQVVRTLEKLEFRHKA